MPNAPCPMPNAQCPMPKDIDKSLKFAICSFNTSRCSHATILWQIVGCMTFVH
ncbi:hypothetical protein [Nostoc sp.]|uniref:hypothetical protein n=1 Tax=Nostoc sp. TaxID=1180 RepID=UPI002FF74A92